MESKKTKKRIKRHPFRWLVKIVLVGGGCILNWVRGRRILWHHPNDWKWLREEWGDITAQPDFPEKFLRLVSGLDKKSTETVIWVLLRIKQIVAKKRICPILDIFTSEEQESLKLVRENFSSKIIKISDNLFAWQNYLLPEQYGDASVLYYRHGISTLKNPDFVKGKAVIDAGACIGDSVLVFSELNPSTIYTFEPVPENFELLKRTLELNHIENAVPENMALGAKDGIVPMRLDDDRGGSSIKIKEYSKKEKYIDVPLRALDSYVAEHPMEIGLIKTDLEGAEPDFLAGAKKTICEQKPILLISIYHNAHDFFEIKPLIESWNLGYRFRIYHPAISRPHAETLLIAEMSD